MPNKNVSTGSDTGAPKDHQDRYDEDLSEYTTGEGLESADEAPEHFSGRFPRDFFQYSQDFRDREDGAPGTDQDYGTKTRLAEVQTELPKLMPEGDGLSESQTDREIREEVMDVLSHDWSLDASDVSARVEDGTVTLSGTVFYGAMKRAIEDSVRLVPGVEEVNNCLIVNPVPELH